MFDPLSLLAGGGLVAAGWLVGHRRRPGGPPKPPASATVCSCGHGYGSHRDGSGCVAQIERPHYYYSGDRNGYEYVPCPCLSYDGPEPLPKVWSTE